MQNVSSTSPNVSQDCLYLNVWRPAAAKGPLPVMVWIYGGGYTGGGASRGREQGEQGEQFAKQGVILVSFNYRLGRLGFFGHPALSAAAAQTGEPLGNYGYMDQIAALKWVKQNIAAFGGDPNDVTVFGESAGGESIHNLITSPTAANLFNKVINQSGNGHVNQAYGRYLKTTAGAPLPSAEEQGVAFAQQFGITDKGATGLAALRALTAKQLIDNLYNRGQFTKVPIMLGTNSADLGFATPAATKDATYAVFGAGNLAAARAAFDSGSRTKPWKRRAARRRGLRDPRKQRRQEVQLGHIRNGHPERSLGRAGVKARALLQGLADDRKGLSQRSIQLPRCARRHHARRRSHEQ